MSTPPKPAGWAAEYAQAFHDEAVARVYHLRPPYPDDLFSTLTELIVDQPRTVLDLGCGPGDLARRLVDAADRLDAVDASIAMIQRGMALERGRQANLRWIHGRAEEVPLDPPYALVTAGDSLHWMDWSVVMPRIQASLTRNGSLAVVGRTWGTGLAEESELLRRYSTNPDFRPLNLVEELESRGLFEKRGERGFSYLWQPTIDEYWVPATRKRAFQGGPLERERLTARPVLCSSAWFEKDASRRQASGWSCWSGPAWSGALPRRDDHVRPA